MEYPILIKIVRDVICNAVWHSMRLQIIFLSLFLALPLARAGEIQNYQLPHATPLTSSNQETDPNLLLAPLDEYYTTALYQTRGLLTPKSKSVFILLGGVGAHASTHGVGKSMSAFVNSLRKMDIDAVAFENPLYFRSELPDADRVPFMEKFGTAKAQADWLFDLIRLIDQQNLKMAKETGMPPKRIFIAGRSFGGDIIMEAIHRYMRGDADAAIMGRVSSALWMGVGPIDVAGLEQWFAAKKKMMELNPGATTEDKLVSATYPNVCKEMTWDSSKEIFLYPGGQGSTSFPKVYAVIGARDEFVSRADQISTAERFSKAHPQVSVHAIGLDTTHDSSRSINYVLPDGKNVVAKVMARLKPLIAEMTDDKALGAPGISFKRNEFYDLIPVNPCDKPLVN